MRYGQSTGAASGSLKNRCKKWLHGKAEFPKFHAIPEAELGWNAAEIETRSLSHRDTPC